MIKNLHMTDLTTFQSCRRQFYFNKIMRIAPAAFPEEYDVSNPETLQSPDTDAKFHFTIGTIGHKCLRDWYAHRRPLLESLKEYGKFLRADYYEILTSLFDEYEAMYADDFDKWDIILVETPMSVKFAELNPLSENEDEDQCIELELDILFRSKANGALFAMDHKFYKTMPNVEEMSMRDQFTGYIAALRETGHNVVGIIANILVKRLTGNPKILEKTGKLSKDKSQSTTYYKYKAMVDILASTGEDVTEYDDILEHLRMQTHPNLRRDIIVKSKDETDTWKKHLKPRIDDIERAIEFGVDNFYHSPGRQCLSCDFLKICQSQLQGGSGAGYIETMFRVKRDNER